MEPDSYDLVVIGSGPAGEKGAAQAAYFGKKVALVEKELDPGGAAANTGTLPSKTLRESALFLSGYRNRGLSHLRLKVEEPLTVPNFMARERLVKENERSRIRANLKRHHVTTYIGLASFVDPHTIAVRPERGAEVRLRGEKVLIATGSYPYRPAELYPFHDPRVYDSDSILHLGDIPASMLVVGGGVVGCEYACMFAALGVKVTLVERRDRLVGFLDDEVADALQARMEAAGIRVLLGDEVAEVHNGEPIEVRLKSGGVARVETVLVSSGRCGNVESLDLPRAGVEVRERGRIVVNEHYQTTAPHIYAAGDVIGAPALASTAMEQARVAMVHAFDLSYKRRLAPILPYGIYTIPECSMAGATEESLRQQGVSYVVGRASYAANARGQIIGDRDGFLKLLFREDDLVLLGVHALGEQAAEIIHVGLTALLLGETADLFIQTCYNYPTLTEMYKYAAYDALGHRDARRKGQA
jgi:NAD(P) transhydrogenase